MRLTEWREVLGDSSEKMPEPLKTVCGCVGGGKGRGGCESHRAEGCSSGGRQLGGAVNLCVTVEECCAGVPSPMPHVSPWRRCPWGGFLVLNGRGGEANICG